MNNEAARWEAVMRKDASCDGQFFFGVLTTGVYCRPSCGARRPRRDNVRFYVTPEDAERDGLRACLRCRPLECAEEKAILERIREALQAGESVAALARQAGWSPAWLNRKFRQAYGSGPAAYRKAAKLHQFKAQLREGGNVTDAIYAAGLGSSSRAYENASAAIGMTPKQYRQGGVGLTLRWSIQQTSLGPLLVACTERGVCFAAFDAIAEDLAAEFPRAHLAETTRLPEAAQLAAFIETGAGDLPLAVQGTPFQRKVWDHLRTIPRGQTRTYSEVAAAIGAPKAVRAVATACASNRIAVAIPCHRVVTAAGGTGQYRWGAERKKSLLEKEAGA
jgi:AraC family transcriptional regulator, regulatory protein of adaptative response / methylated-DNA-[protein]-cysteine methyltransferase